MTGAFSVGRPPPRANAHRPVVGCADFSEVGAVASGNRVRRRLAVMTVEWRDVHDGKRRSCGSGVIPVAVATFGGPTTDADREGEDQHRDKSLPTLVELMT